MKAIILAAGKSSRLYPITLNKPKCLLNVNGKKLRVVAVYMPHTGYSEEKVDEIYEILDSIIDDARKKNMHVILGGDWNAKVSFVFVEDFKAF